MIEDTINKTVIFWNNLYIKTIYIFVTNIAGKIIFTDWIRRMDFGKNETPVADEADSFVSSNQILTDLEDLQIQSPIEKDNQDFLKHKTASPKSKTIFQFLFFKAIFKENVWQRYKIVRSGSGWIDDIDECVHSSDVQISAA